MQAGFLLVKHMVYAWFFHKNHFFEDFFGFNFTLDKIDQ